MNNWCTFLILIPLPNELCGFQRQVLDYCFFLCSEVGHCAEVVPVKFVQKILQDFLIGWSWKIGSKRSSIFKNLDIGRKIGSSKYHTFVFILITAKSIPFTHIITVHAWIRIIPLRGPFGVHESCLHRTHAIYKICNTEIKCNGVIMLSVESFNSNFIHNSKTGDKYM